MIGPEARFPIMPPVYEVTVQTEFCAAHAIWIRGERETLHGHNWRVTVVVAGPELDGDGLLCDFHEVERALAAVVAPWRDRSLNDVAPFAPDGRGVNPTAERVAETIGRAMESGLGGAVGGGLPPGARVASVSVTEAPGCVARWLASGRSE
jgi:6-pyruvoyltetrahydropterin/6-carboxytetrahydropterin synthase